MRHTRYWCANIHTPVPPRGSRRIRAETRDYTWRKVCLTRRNLGFLRGGGQRGVGGTRWLTVAVVGGPAVLVIARPRRVLGGGVGPT